jgi:hypothetical protein
MTTIYTLTIIDGFGSGEGSTTVHRTAADAEATLRLNFDQAPSDFASLNFAQLRAALSVRDGLNIDFSAHELPEVEL